MIKEEDFPKSPLEILARSIIKNEQWQEEPVHETYNFYRGYLSQQIVIEATSITAGMASGAATKGALSTFVAMLANKLGKFVPKHIYVRLGTAAISFYMVYQLKFNRV